MSWRTGFGGAVVIIAISLTGGSSLATESPSPLASAETLKLADPTKEVAAIRKSGVFKLDGQLEEKFWQEAPSARGFRQTWPKEGEAASESTWIKLAYDDEALYVGIICFDSHPEKIRHRLTRRDRSTEADYVMVNIDSYHDHQTAYSFAVNASGVQRDKYIYNNDWTDDTWDGVWESKVGSHPSGWTVEMRIPYHCLRFPPEASQTWGIDFIRYISRNDETTRWEFVPRAEAAGVSRYGVLEGIANISPPRHLTILPYSVAKIKTEPQRVGNPDGRESDGNLGADVKWALSPNTILDAAVNPDFGQVEADATVLNLSRFETRYPEKRPFFQEGLQLFDTDFNLFYSRRVGASVNSPDAASTDDVISQPDVATILYAGKLSGKTKSGVSYSMLNAVTADEYARYFNFTGTDTSIVRQRVANRSVANVGRIKKDIWGNSSVGVMATALNRDGANPAYAGAVDWNLKTKKGVWGVRGQTVASSPSAGPSGWGVSVAMEKYSGKHLRGNMGIEHEDRALNLNDLGYLRRADYTGGWQWLYYRTDKPFGPFLQTNHNINTWYGWNTSGQRLSLGGNYNTNIELKNQWWIGGGVARDAARLDDREIPDGTPFQLPPGYDVWTWGNTDSRKPIYYELNYGWGTNRDGGYNNYSVYANFRPASNVECSIGPSYNLDYNVSRYVADIPASGLTPAGYLFAEQSTKTYAMTVRGIATFTTALSVQFYGETFLADVKHDNYKRLTGPRSYVPAPELSRDGGPDDPDFSVLSFNANVVMRWEYRPGSTLFLVWTQARDDFDQIPDFSLHRGVDRLFRLGSQNVFMAKLNYWWNL